LVAPILNRSPSPLAQNELKDDPKAEESTSKFEKFKTLIKKQLNKRGKLSIPKSFSQVKPLDNPLPS
jgi:hypothetical protein